MPIIGIKDFLIFIPKCNKIYFMIMQMTKTKKFKVFLLSVITGLTALTTGFFAYTAVGMFHALHSKTYGSLYSLKQSGMIFVNGHNGLKLAYPSLSGGLSGASF